MCRDKRGIFFVRCASAQKVGFRQLAELIKWVWRLQQRIYRAESQGNKRLVRNLQRLLVQSRAVRLLSIRRITQVNKGKRTAGIDG